MISPRNYRDSKIWFSPTCTPTSEPATIRCILAEDSRRQGQRQRTLLFLTQQEAWTSACLPVPLPPKSHRGHPVGPHAVGLFHNRGPRANSCFDQAANIIANGKKTDSPSTEKHAVTWLSHSSGLGLLSCLCDKLEKLLSIRRRVKLSSLAHSARICRDAQSPGSLPLPKTTL